MLCGRWCDMWQVMCYVAGGVLCFSFELILSVFRNCFAGVMPTNRFAVVLNTFFWRQFVLYL